MTTENLKPFRLVVTIMGHNKEDVIERMEDFENPIDSWIDESIIEVKQCPHCLHLSLITYPANEVLPGMKKCERCAYMEDIE